jgi:Family of unknown function (DUF6069)
MTEYHEEQALPVRGGVSSAPPQVDARRMWSGGVATAVVAALIALVGMLVAHGLFGVDLYPSESSRFSPTAIVCLAAAVAALAATGLLHLLLLTVPRPRAYFTWIVGLVTAALVVLPIVGQGSLGERLAAATLNLVLGIAICSLVNGVARSAVRRQRADW